MNWHFFAMYGMMPFGIQTDPCMKVFCDEVKAAMPDINIHDSPYRDAQVNEIAGIIGELPSDDGVFVAGTSLGANNVPVVCARTHHEIDGAFGFQASLYGVHSPFTENVKFAHLISSDNPLPFPGLGAYRWERGEMTGGLILEVRNVPHPGDYVAFDRAKYIREMKTIRKTRE